MDSRPERVTGHTGIEIRPRLLREAAVGNFGLMSERMTQQYHVSDEVFWYVKLCQGIRKKIRRITLSLNYSQRKLRLTPCQQPR